MATAPIFMGPVSEVFPDCTRKLIGAGGVLVAAGYALQPFCQRGGVHALCHEGDAVRVAGATAKKRYIVEASLLVDIELNHL